jgi:glycogen operon protein
LYPALRRLLLVVFGGLACLDWDVVREKAELHRFCRLLIQFRKSHPAVRHAQHPGQGAPKINRHGTRAWRAGWSPGNRVLAFHRIAKAGDGMDVIYVAMNLRWDALDFELPTPPTAGKRWHEAANTALTSPDDIFEGDRETPLTDQAKICVGGRSIIILIAR